MGETESSHGLHGAGIGVQGRGLVRLTLPPEQGERDKWLGQAEQVLSTWVAQPRKHRWRECLNQSVLSQPRSSHDSRQMLLLLSCCDVVPPQTVLSKLWEVVA